MHVNITAPWMAIANSVPNMIHRDNTVVAAGQYDDLLYPWAQRAAFAPGYGEQQADFPIIGQNPMAPVMQSEVDAIRSAVYADQTSGQLNFGRVSGALGRTMRVGGGIRSGAMLGALGASDSLGRRTTRIRPGGKRRPMVSARRAWWSSYAQPVHGSRATRTTTRAPRYGLGAPSTWASSGERGRWLRRAERQLQVKGAGLGYLGQAEEKKFYEYPLYWAAVAGAVGVGWLIFRK